MTDGSVTGISHEVLPQIYTPENNLVIWHREPCASVEKNAASLCNLKTFRSARGVFNVDNSESWLNDTLSSVDAKSALIEDMTLLIDMFACLFELNTVGVRISRLDQAMCPRFHVDRVPCRLAITYLGPGTQWLANSRVNRLKLGPGSGGKPDEESGLFQPDTEIYTVPVQSVALLKGDSWIDNEGRGVVHRSPGVSSTQARILMTVDFGDS